MNIIITAVMTIVIIALCLTGCSPQTPPATPKTDTPSTRTSGFASNAAEAANRFAFEMYRRLRVQGGNVFFSPLSISAALTMTAEGAKGDTAKQMAGVLHLPSDMSGVRDFYHKLTGRNPSGYELNLANAIWVQQDFKLLPDFVNLLGASYGAAAREVDFLNNPGGSVRTINGWVEQKTGKRIKDLLSTGDLNAYTRLILTNAIYMKAEWESQFKKESTFPDVFNSPGGQRQVPFMHQTSSYPYYENTDLQMIELPYRSRDLSMLAILPKTVAGISDVEKKLDSATFTAWAAGLKVQRVMVALPKVKMEQKFELANLLKEMGMPLPFDQKADFSGITIKSALQIDKVIHQSYVNIDEKGTEAAAATAVAMVGAAMIQGEPPREFKADHPFVVIIKDKLSGSILFMGCVMEPRQ